MVLSLTTQQLEYLVAIHRSETWARAAASVGVTPSALSQGIGELERRLGLVLFERDGRRRVPTRDHAEVLHYAQSTLAATADLERWIDRRRGGETGEVRLGMIDAAATHHFRDVLLAYRRRSPEVDLHLAVGPSSELLARLARADLDLVVCVEATPPLEGISQEPLVEDPLAVLAPAGAGSDEPGSWGPWVTFPAGSHTRQLIGEALRRVGARFEVVAESHQPEVLREMVLLGIGWTVLPLAGLAPAAGIRVVREQVAVRRLVLARRVGSPPDAVTDDLAALLSARR